MNTRLLIAPAAAGKTQHCIERVQQVRRDDPLARIWVVLPDAAEARAVRRRLAQRGGAIGVQTGTFHTLYAELLTLAGQSKARLDEPVLHRLLRNIVDELHADGKLDYYASLRDKPGFLRALRTMIQDLKRARATSQNFLDAVEGRGPRLEELAAIYLGYQKWFYESPWADAEGQGWLAAMRLEDFPDLCASWRLLVVDGFDQFNPTQLEVLRRLATQAQETLITLTGAEPARMAHRRFARARAAVESALGVEAEPLPDARVRLAPPLAHLEASLFEAAPPAPEPSDGALALLETPSRTEEVRAALRWLKTRYAHYGIPLHEMAILARSLEPYRPFLEETAAEFGLPLMPIQGDWLDENPAVAALLDLLALPLRNWPRRLVVEAWRSPYFDWSNQQITRQDADLLDAAARHGQVIAGLSQWREALDRLATVDADPSDRDDAAGEDSDEAAVLEAPTGPAAAALRAKLDVFVTRLTPLPRGTFRDHTAWLETLIGDDPDLTPDEQSWKLENSLGIVARARYGLHRHSSSPPGLGEGPGVGVQPLPTAERDVAALRRLKDVLRSLVFAEYTLGEPQPISYERFWRELRGAVEATSYRAPPPGNQGTLLAASVLAARGLTFRAVALLGLSEGEFPRAPRQDPLLHESDREMLQKAGVDLEPRLLGDEVTIFYEAVTRAREQLLVTRPYLAEDGQPWEPSPYWEQLCRLTGAQPRAVRPEDPLPPPDAASWAEFLSAMARALARPDAVPAAHAHARQLAEDPQWQAVQTGAGVLAARMAGEAQGPFEGDLSSLRSHLSRSYGPQRPWSASRLETYAVCPYAFFAAYGLGLEPRQPVEAGYDVRQLGSMYHFILESVFRRAAETGEAPANILPEIAGQVFDTAPETYGFRPTPLWAQQRAEHERILATTIAALVEASDGWEPAHFEPPFGLHGAPPLELRDADGATLRLRGYIDRVDVNSDGQLRVIDYKSGSAPISARDLTSGKRVQLALYALAARDVLGLGEPAAGMYWHIGSARPSSLKLERYKGGIEAALSTAVAHALSFAAGARQGHFPPKPPDGGCPNWCSAADFCWRYQPRGW
ncbi:MAG: PD-(D/E)XK nuclease family protein [Anaerolineae bacterium]